MVKPTVQKGKKKSVYGLQDFTDRNDNETLIIKKRQSKHLLAQA